MEMDLQAVIHGKLGEAYALSPWTENRLDEIIHLVDAYAQQQYEKGYKAALTDAQMAALRVSYGIEGGYKKNTCLMGRQVSELGIASSQSG